MRELLQSQLDFVFLVYGFSFIILGIVACALHHRARFNIGWIWLAFFGFLHGINEWLDMLVFSRGDGDVFSVVRLGLMAASFLSLIEFGRRALARDAGWPGLLTWHLPLIGLAALGGFAGVAGLNATARYAIGFPGSVLTAVVFWRYLSPERNLARGASLLIIGAFLLYAIAAGLIVPAAGFWPASRLNHSQFIARTGFPVQILRAGCAGASAFGLWLVLRSLDELQARHVDFMRRYLLPSGIASVFAVGWLVTDLHGKTADHEMRESVLRQATAIARAIDPGTIGQLSFTSTDKGTAPFQRLRQQMIAYGKAICQHSIYSMSMRDGKLFFGPENLAEDDPNASPPGTRYEQPSPANLAVFQTAKGVTEGPYTDEYGTFVSGLAPILDPRTRNVVAVIGVDVLATDWNKRIAAQRLGPILSTLAISVLLAAGSQILAWRSRVPMIERRRLVHVEAVLSGVTGIVLTTALALGAADTDERAYRQSFHQMADGQAKALHDALHLTNIQLEALARVCQDAGVLSPQMFTRNASFLLRDANVDAFEWVPAIPAGERMAFEDMMRGQLQRPFTIRQFDQAASLKPVPAAPVYYPVAYAAPEEINAKALGLDLASEPLRRAAVEEALATGLMTATAPVRLIQDASDEPSVLLCQPVAARHTPGSAASAPSGAGTPGGVVVAILRIKAMLQAALIRSDVEPSSLEIDLYRIAADRKPELLTWLCDSTCTQHENSEALLPSWQSGLSFTCPLFLLGRPYALLVHPSQEFIATHPRRSGMLTAIAGIVLTAGVSLAVGVLGLRRMSLEAEVQARSLALHEKDAAYRRQFADNKAIMLIVDVETGAILDANAAAADFYGYSIETLRTMRMSSINVLPEGIQADLRAAVLANRGGELEFTHRLADGSSRNVEVYASVIESNGHEVIHSIVQDITDRKRAEMQLAEYHEGLEHLVKERTRSLLQAEEIMHQQEKLASVGQLAAGVAHEINTPMQYVGDNLRAIKDSLEDLLSLETQYRELVDLIKSGADPTEKIKSIEEAEEEYDVEYLIEDTPKAISQGLEGVDRVTKIVRAMKEFSHAGLATTSMVDINHSLQSTLTVSRNEYKYVADAETDFGELPEVECYAAEMNQVFLNLVVNAAHAIADTGEHGKITVRTRLVDEQVEIAIQDTGTGIPEHARRKIFDPFFTTKEVGKGTGQGLYLAHQVVSRHSGSITFETEMGKGTTFMIRLPLRLPEKPESTDDQAEPAASQAGA